MKKISLDLIILIVAALILIGGVTMSYMAFYKIDPVVMNDAKERSKFLAEEAKNLKVSFYSLPKIQTNIENDASRLVQAEMTVVLEPEAGVTNEVLKSYESFITDLVINTVAQSNFDDLNNVSGKIILAEKIKNGTNEIMKRKAVKRVLFSTFSVQLQ